MYRESHWRTIRVAFFMGPTHSGRTKPILNAPRGFLRDVLQTKLFT